MKTHPATIVKRLLWIAIVFPVATFGDQTDGRLDELFAALKSSEDVMVRAILETAETHKAPVILMGLTPELVMISPPPRRGD